MEFKTTISITKEAATYLGLALGLAIALGITLGIIVGIPLFKNLK